MTKYNGRTWEIFPAEGRYWYAGPKYKAISPAPGSYLEGDARLIAAAPKLLEACRAILDIVNESHGVYGYHLNGDGAPWCRDFPEEVEALEKAVAQVEVKG